MRIGYVLTNFSPLSETFIRREILALCDLGHRVHVYAQRLTADDRASRPLHPNLRAREIHFEHDHRLLPAAAVRDGIEHLHGSLMKGAHQGTWNAARAAGIAFSVTAYSGHSLFTEMDPGFYRDLSRDELCEGFIVEDPFIRDWVVERLDVDASRVHILANPIETKLYCPGEEDDPREPQVLAIARFVEKKGLVHLVEGFRRFARTHPGWRLKLVGGGPEEARLRSAAAGSRAIQFAGFHTEAECLAAYRQSEIMCMPCVRAADGDADGVPTTVLEAMSVGLSIIASDLLSMPYYVRDQKEGLLVPPADSRAIADALATLAADRSLRRQLGANGRQRVLELCDLTSHAIDLERLFLDARRRLADRRSRTLRQPSRPMARTGTELFDWVRGMSALSIPASGRVLMLDGRTAGLQAHVFDAGSERSASATTDRSVDTAPAVAVEERALPFSKRAFDCIVSIDALTSAFDMDHLLEQIERLLTDHGRLRILETSPDEARLNPASPEMICDRLHDRFEISAVDRDAEGTLTVACARRCPGEATPLVSVVITAYNRERYLVRAIESALQQSYPHVEVVVVDDGSSDGTAQVLERFGERIRRVTHPTNRGIAAAKNSGLRATSTEARYVAILDSDDLFGRDVVERCVAVLEGSPEAGLVYVDSVYIDAFGRVLRETPGIEPWSLDEFLRTSNLRGDTWLARRDLVFQTDLHDESLPLDVDFDLFYQLLELTTFTHLPGPCVYHTVHDESSSRRAFEMAKCHAANLVKYGYSSEYAFHRARKNPEWVPMIEEGIRLGLEKRERREARLREEKEKLAVLGGRPVRSALLSNEGLAPTDEILIELAAAVRRGWIGPGPRVEELERQLAARVGAPHAVALGSASAGIVLSLIASGVRAGDEVIIASLGDPSSIHAIERAGATPVLVDVHPDSLTLDPDAVRAAVTARSRAIVATHFGGLPCDLAALSQIAELHDLALIEDASDALGAECAGHWIGGHGRLTVFSFSGARAVLTGAGGMLTTHDPETAARLRRLSRDGAQCAPQNGPLAPPARPQSIDELGFDCGMTDLAAAVALPQVRHLERHLARRREIADLYDEALAGFPLRLQTRAAAKGSRHAVQRYIVLLEADAWKASRDRVVEALRAENIGARAAGLAMHEQPHHRRRFPTDGAGLPQVESASRCLFDLPVTGQMSDADVESVVRAFRKVAKAYCL